MKKLSLYACITGLILTLSLFCSIALSYAVTTSGPLVVDEVWSGTINLTGDVTVPQGVTLTIEAGTEVVFPAGADDMGGGNDTALTELIVNGSLVAVGTESNRIRFTSGAFFDEKGDWGGIRINSRESLTMRYCTIEHAGLGVEYRATGLNASAAIENSIIRETGGDGIAIYAEAGAVRTVSVTNNEVHSNDGIGIRIQATGQNTILTNTITGNTVHDNGSYGIYFDTQSYAKSTSTVSGNEIYNNVTYGLYSYGNGYQTTVSAEITGNTIHDSGMGVYIYNYRYAGSPSLRITDNTIYNSTTGIYCYTYSYDAFMSPVIEDNNIYDNTGIGIYVYGYSQSYNNPTIRHNTITNNGSDGIRVQRSNGSVIPVITLNEVTGNTGRGLYVQSTGSATILHNTVTGNAVDGLYLNSTGVANVNFNNIADNTGSYELYNDSGSAVDARYNWWGGSPTAQMNAGDNPKNITKIYDIYDNGTKGGADYSQWLSQTQTITTDPVSWIKDPVDGLAMKAASYTITGTATAVAGIERVEVSTDGGITWNFATGKENWTYEWTITGDGTYTIKSRVIASDDTIETPGAGHAVTIDSSLPTTSGALTSDETWTGEVAITGDITVPEGVTLTLEPGAVIRFPALADDAGGGSDTSRSELIVNGALIAEGTESNRIVFTSSAAAPARNDWGGIRASSNESLTMRHCTIEYAGLGVEYRATGLNASAAIENSIIRETGGDGIAVYAEAGAVRTVSVTNNEVHANDGIGIRIQATGQNTVLTNTITGNTVHDNGSYGIYFDTQSYAKSTSTVSGNEIYSNATYGLYSYAVSYAQASAQITGNTIHDSGMGVYIYNYIYSTSPSLRIADNSIYNSTTGIYCYTYHYDTSMSPVIEDNNIYNNTGIGIHVHGGGWNRYNQSFNNPTIRHNTVTNNGSDGVKVQRSNGTVIPVITLNEVTGNTGRGLYVQSSGSATILHNTVTGNGADGLYLNSTGVANVNFNNIADNTGSYELYNDSGSAVDARYNWWGGSPTAQMNAGDNPKNITKIYDIYDNGAKGGADYSQWLTQTQTLTTDPVSWIKDPVDGLTMKAASYTITGAATALAGIERVEVSTDGGVTWNFATGKTTWTYEWTIPGDETYTIKSRVIASDDTIETPGAGHTVTINWTETTVAGTLESDETWSGDVSLEGDITIPEGVTLTILPGTTVAFPAFFDSTYSGENSSQSELIVNGTLLAEGTEGEPILFTSDAPWNSRKGDWLGIRVNGNLRLKNAVVEYAAFGIKFVGDEDADEIHIQNCTIHHNSGHGIDVYVDNNANISALIDSNIIFDNDGNGISCRAYTGSTTLNLNISGNTVSDNGDTGIYCFADGGSGDPAIIGTICNNTVFGHTTHGIYSYTYQGARSELTIDNNTVHQSGTGIYANYNRASSASSLDVTNNTAHTGTEGIKIYTYDSSLSPLILNNAVYDHVSNGITCSYGGADTYDMVPRIEGNQVFDNCGNGIYLKATEQVTVFNNGLYNNYSFDLYNDSVFDINARSNWWGVNTTNQINSGINPKNISTIFDFFDDSSKGTVDYADWLSLYETPNPPTLDPVESPTQGETITLLPIPSEGLVACYPFNGNANDESENANDGIVNGAILTEDRFGNPNSAYRFDGVDDYIGEYATDVSDNFTISLWVYPEEPHQVDVQSTSGTRGTSGQNYVISPVHYGDSGDAGAGISVGSNGVSVYEHASSYMPAPLVWQGTLNNWTNIILVYQNKKPSLFVNGSFVKSGYISPKNHVYGNNSSTGGYAYGYFKGYIDDVRIYNRVLSESEIQQLFNENISSAIQTLSGTKDGGASIILNGTEVVFADEETTWSCEMPLYEGTNPITLYSRTTAGMASGVVISSITRDTTAPAIYSSVPADGAFVSRSLESVDITLIEEGTEINAEATLAGAVLKDDSETEVPGQWSIDYNHVVFIPDQPLGVGSYTVTLYPTDMPLGNTRTSIITFTIDLTAPAVPTLNEILTPTKTTPQTISGGKDAGTSIWLDNFQIVPSDDLTEWSYNLSLLEGENTHRLYARDQAGNHSDEIIFTTILDRAPPILQSTEPANGAFVNESPSRVAFFFTDLTTSLAEDPTLATASMRDSSSQEISGIWELLVPNTVVFTPVYPLDEDTYTANVQAHDLAGNTTSSTISFTYDGTPPSPSTLEPVQSPTIFAVQTLSGTKEANASIWLNGIEVIAVNAETDWFYQITLQEGENSLEIYSKDAAGNQSGSVFSTIIYDETAPLPVSNLTTNGSGIGTTVTLDWTGYDEQIQGDIDYYRVYAQDHLFTQVAELEPINTLPAGTFTYTADNLAKGTLYYFAVVAVDTKGNALSSVTPVSAVPTDTVAPEDVINLQVQCFDTGLIFTWDHSANTYGDLAGYKAYFNNSTEAVLLTSSQTTHEQTGLNSATAYPFKVSAYDTDGNESNGISITGVTLLANPAIVSVTPYSGYVDITWDGVVPSQLVKHYSVYVSETDFSTVQGMAPRLSTAGTSAKVAGLTNNKMYYFAITSVNLSGGETKVVSAVSATPVPDTQGPEISDVKLDDTAFSDSAVLNSSGTFTLNVIDPASLSRVEFYIDGVLYYTDSNGSNSYSCFLNIAFLEDGSHTLTITAYDTLGNSTSINYSLVIALDPPAAPTITTPSNGMVTNNSMITISGSGEKDTEIILYNNGAEAGAPTPVDANENFSIPLTLTEGENRIQAAAINRAGTGPQSAEVLVTLDTNIPQSPTHLFAVAKASGLIRLAWQKPLESSAKGYHLYRAATSFNSREEATQINSNLITGTSFDDLTPEDGTWYYRVSTVDTADNESELSDEAFAQADSTLPIAASIQYTPTGQYDQATGRMAPGLVDVLLTVSEPLQTTPFLSITPESGVPISVELTKSADLEYTGFFVISDTTPTGTAYAVFSGRDMVGNRGTEIDSGGSIEIDTSGPAVIEIAIQPADPVKNDQTNPVSVTASIGLNEVMKPGETPQLSYLLSAEGRSATVIEPLTQISAQSGHAQTWQVTFQLPDDAGLSEVETLEFIYSGVDDLDNVSANILCANHFQIYQGDLPPLALPQGLTGQSLPGGRISLSWNEVEGAVGYQLYRQAPDEVELTAYERLETVLEFMDEPSFDGLYIYAIASIRQENEQESISGMSSSVEVASDSVSPGAPQNLLLDLVGQGIEAVWEAPPYTEPVTFSLYRADLTEITSVQGLEPVITGITETTAVDSQPSHTEHCYVVTAVDSAGNESAPSNSFYLNFALLPVPSLHVFQGDDDSPIVSWTQPGGSIAGYNLYLGPEDQILKVNETLLADLSYKDTGYTGDERRYTVVAVDENGEESPGRSITLPQVRATLLDGEQIKRGIMNRLEYRVENLSTSRADNISLSVNIEGRNHVSESFSLEPSALSLIPVVVGGYADLPDVASMTTTIIITPHENETVEIVCASEIEVNDGMLVIGILNEEFVRGGAGTVRFTLENTGEEEIEIVTATGSGSSPSNEITFYLLDPDGNVLSSTPFKQYLGEGIVTLANGNTVARIPAGSVFTSEPLEIPVPVSSPDDVTIRLAISQIYYHQGKPDQVSMAGVSTTRQISLVDTSYYGEIISIAPESSSGNEDILITGQAVERDTDLPMPNVPLDLVISVNGFERKYSLFTEDDGSFSYTFTPLSGESGLYKVWAVHPDLLDKPVQGEFVINRLSISSSTINLNVPKNYEQEIGIQVAAGDGTQVHNLMLVYDELDQPTGAFPEGVHVTIGDSITTLGSGETGSLSVTLWADNNAEEIGRLVLKVKSDETGNDSWGSVIINTHFSDAQPVLYFTPDHVETGLAFDETVNETIILENRGVADLTDVSLTIVSEEGTSAPDWVHLNTASDQGVISIGDTREVGIAFSPTTGSVAEGMYLFYLRVTSSNYQTTDIALYVSVTQSGVGGALFKVADIYTGTVNQNNEIIQGLAGAKIKVQNEEVLTIEQTQTTDSLGEVFFTDLPAGRYKCRITADNHQEYIGRLWIKPGITVTDEVFLSYNLVTVEWEVTETTIEDKYEIVLNATYETDVPAAVVVAEPSSITLPEMKAGDVYYGEFTLTNYGLICAKDLNFALPEDDNNFRYELLTGMPDSLEAKERITVPYKVTCLNSLDQEEDQGTGGGSGCHLRCIRICYLFECMNIHTGYHWFETRCTTYCFFYGECGGQPNDDDDGPGPWDIVIDDDGPGPYTPKPTPPPDKIVGIICWPVAVLSEDILLDINVTDIIHKVGCTVNNVSREFNDDAVDMSVKVPGGSVSVQRRFYGNQWRWEHLRNSLRFNYDSLGQYIESVDKGGVVYEKSSAVPAVYTHDTYKITKEESGYAWKDKLGNWKEYDLNGRMTSYGTRTGVIEKLLYEEGENGKLIGIADRNDMQVIWFEYDGDGRISAVQDTDSRRVEYSYTDGLLTSVTDILENETLYEYDTDGKITKTIDAAGRPTLVSYDGYSNVAAVVDREGSGHFFQYDYDEAKQEYYAQIKTSSGMIKEVWYDRDGETKQVDVNGRTIKKIVKDGRDLIITDEKGNITRKEFDEWENLTRVVYPDGSEVSFEYDLRFNKVSLVTDLLGNVAEHDYDDQGNLFRKTEAVGTDAERVTTFTYDEYGQLLTATIEADANTNAATTTFTYDDNGNLSSISDPERNKTEFLSYNNMGKLLEMKDPRGYTWIYEYDDIGRLIAQTDPLENTTAYEYDGANNRTAVINGYLKKFDFEYDDHNNIIKAIDPYEKYRVNEYNTDDLVTQTIDEEGKKALFEYDNEGRLVKAIDGAGNETVYEYDESLETSVSSYKPVRIVFPTYTRRIYYDNLQRVIRETDILDENTSHSTSYVYDAGGNLTSETDAEGNITRYEYDALNRLTQITDSMGGVTERSFDDRGNLIAMKDPNNGITQYEYDRNNRLVKMIRPMGEETVYEYDAAGNRITVFDAKGQKISYEYDEVNRLTTVSYFAAGDHDTPLKTVEFTYNKLGRLETYNDGTTSATYTYDDLQQKTGESVNYGPFTLSYSYSYNANGVKKSFTGPNGITINYTYDANNRLGGVTIPGQGQITYNTYHWNSPAKITLPGGTTEEYGYDPRMQLKYISAKDPGQNALMAYNYTHSPAGNITEKNTEHGNYAYQYDELYRLTEATNPNANNESYTYDAIGNRLSAAGVTGTWNYNDNNELLGYVDVLFEYDNNGNMTKKTVGDQVVTYLYDITDRLIRVEDGDGSVIAEYYYDPFGRRLWKEVGGARTCYLYADEGLVGEYNSSGGEIKTYGYAPDSVWTTNPLFQSVGGNYYWYQNDHLATPQKLIDTSGRVVWAATYDAFGNIQISVAEVENDLRFPGQYYDAETGLYYNWNRYYDPVVGRYLRTDPYNEGINLYAYVFGNPVNLVDPEGLCIVKEIGSVSGGFIRGMLDSVWINTFASDDYKIRALERGDMDIAIQVVSVWEELNFLAFDAVAIFTGPAKYPIVIYVHAVRQGIKGYEKEGTSGAAKGVGLSVFRDVFSAGCSLLGGELGKQGYTALDIGYRVLGKVPKVIILQGTQGEYGFDSAAIDIADIGWNVFKPK